jgi:hypothetical protein
MHYGGMKGRWPPLTLLLLFLDGTSSLLGEYHTCGTTTLIFYVFLTLSS